MDENKGTPPKYPKGELRYCQYCHQGFTKNNTLNRHRRTHLEHLMKEKKFKCDYCDTSYNNYNRFERHVAKHGEILSIKNSFGNYF